MRHLKNFPLFESEEDLKFTYEDLSPEDLQLELSRLKKMSSDFKNEDYRYAM